MAITRDAILSALKAEQEASQKGVPLEVISADREDAYFVIAAKSGKGRARIAIDDGLEGVRVKWGAEFEHGGIVKFVDADRDRIILEPLSFMPPTAGTTIWLFLNDFLGPLIELWGGEMGKRAAKRLRQTREETEPLQEIKPLPAAFSDLRERQSFAVQNAAYRASLMIGPPGTGKSFTVGALAACLLTRFSKARILVVGPTNVAVDTAILAIDDWFARLGRADLAQQIKRVGAHFDPRKYVDRPHLLAQGIAEKATEFLLLEMSEPAKSRVGEYARWKDRMASVRASLAADIAATAKGARIVGVTVSTAVKWQAALTDQAFPFVICDEASQIIGPAAMMMTALGQQTIFAGDPQQLAPIVRTEGKQAEGILGRTAFEVFAHVPTVRLNEQSRMAWAICHAIGATFYENDLAVCKKASRDDAWKAARAPFFVDGREVPRVCFDAVPEPATYSARYGGFIRFGSAKLVEQIVDELAGRRNRLGAKQREVLWPVFEAARKTLKVRGMVTLCQLYADVAAHYASRSNKPYTHVIVDEAQDLGVNELRMMAALAGGPGALFFAGDLGQRIFQHPFSWKSLGVDVRGRSSSLRINYRTSRQIREAADKLLPPKVSDVDGIEDSRADAQSVFEGLPPEVAKCQDEAAEADAVAAFLRVASEAGIAPFEIGAFVRSDEQLARARAAIGQAGLTCRQLSDRVEDHPECVALGTMHFAKGLEFKAVAVMACDDEALPLQTRIDEATDEDELREVFDTERHLFYVACTRARDRLHISGVKPTSEFLDDLLDTVN